MKVQLLSHKHGFYVRLIVFVVCRVHYVVYSNNYCERIELLICKVHQLEGWIYKKFCTLANQNRAYVPFHSASL